MKKVVESVDCVLLLRKGCKNVVGRVKKEVIYLIIFDRKIGKKIKYIVKVIVLWKFK